MSPLLSLPLLADSGMAGKIQDEYNARENKRTISIRLGNLQAMINQPPPENGEIPFILSLSTMFEGKKLKKLDALKIYANGWMKTRERLFGPDSKMHVYAFSARKKRNRNPIERTFEIGQYDFNSHQTKGQSYYIETIKFLPIRYKVLDKIMEKKHFRYRIDDKIKNKALNLVINRIEKFLNYLENL